VLSYDGRMVVLTVEDERIGWTWRLCIFRHVGIGGSSVGRERARSENMNANRVRESIIFDLDVRVVESATLFSVHNVSRAF